MNEKRTVVELDWQNFRGVRLVESDGLAESYTNNDIDIKVTNSTYRFKLTEEVFEDCDIKNMLTLIEKTHLICSASEYDNLLEDKFKALYIPIYRSIIEPLQAKETKEAISFDYNKLLEISSQVVMISDNIINKLNSDSDLYLIYQQRKQWEYGVVSWALGDVLVYGRFQFFVSGNDLKHEIIGRLNQ